MDHASPWPGLPGRLRFSSPSGGDDDAFFAALDLGTNNCRLMIAAGTSDGFRVGDSYSPMVRLGEGLHSTGVLSASALDWTMAALHSGAERTAC